MNKETRIRLMQKRASLQRAIALWLQAEEIPLHSASVDGVALKMMLGAEAAFATALWEKKHYRVALGE